MKIAVFARPGASTAVLLNWLIREGYTDLYVILETAPRRLKQIRQRVRRLGFRRALGQAMFMAVLMPILRWESATRRSELRTHYGLDETMPRLPRVLHIDTINDAVVVDKLRSTAVDVILVNGTSIIRAPVLATTKAPIINTHVGITPDYRGVHGGYWAMWNNEPEKFGTTLHLVDEGIDTGNILAQVTARPDRHDNIASYPLLQQAKALELLKGFLDKIARGEKLSVSSETSGKGTQWFHPTLLQYACARLRGVR
ncbi:MAG: hypothetical protein KDD75_05185 [Caldilineaceae bacterium]|nr:hypothetical protein [Caldilineaceae bacterium]